MRPFAPYNPAAGVQVNVLRAHNLPLAAISFGLMSLAPPGALCATAPEHPPPRQ